jgi:hypothetical protein
MMFESEMRYEIDGRKVSEDEWLKHLEDEAVRSVREAVADAAKRAAAIPCPEHGEYASISIQPSAEGATVHVQACCKAEETRAQERLSRALG